LCFSSASHAAQLTVYHYNNGTGESVSIANGINCNGGSCSGPYLLAAGREGTLTNCISVTNGEFGIWYGYRTSSYPYYECGGAALGKNVMGIREARAIRPDIIFVPQKPAIYR